MPNKAYKVPATGKGRKPHIILIESSEDSRTAIVEPSKGISFGTSKLKSSPTNLGPAANVGFWGKKEETSLVVGSITPEKTLRKAAIEKNAISMEQALRPLAAVAETIRDALVAANNPGQIQIEFGVELGGSAGIPLVTSGTAKANFKVTLTWNNQKAQPNGETK